MKRSAARRSKVNVLFLHSQTGFAADSAVHELIMRHLDRDRFTVHVACPAEDGGQTPPALARFLELADVHVRPTRFAPGFRHRKRDEIFAQLRSAAMFPPDLVGLAGYVASRRIHLIHGTDRPRDAVYGLGLGKLTGARSIVHVHVAWSLGYSAPAKLGVRRADGVFAISRFVADTVVATGTPRTRVYTVLNGIDVSAWNPALADGDGVRREFGIPRDAPLLASVSRLFAQKGQRELLRAMAKVRREIPDVRLLVVGADAVEVHGGSFTAELRKLAAELGIADRVVFTGPRSDVANIMSACDVFALPSFEEPFGLVYVEAMAMRRPVVAVNNGGTPEVVEHGRSGLLSDQGDIDALASNLVTLLRDRALREKMGEYGRARVLAQFSADRMALDAAAAYDDVLSRHR
jgi:glycosyltransferase involved in cell wall biosynthesis